MRARSLTRPRFALTFRVAKQPCIVLSARELGRIAFSPGRVSPSKKRASAAASPSKRSSTEEPTSLRAERTFDSSTATSRLSSSREILGGFFPLGVFGGATFFCLSPPAGPRRHTGRLGPRPWDYYPCGTP